MTAAVQGFYQSGYFYQGLFELSFKIKGLL